MATLSDPKWEMFCNFIARGYNNAEAYAAAGFQPSSIENARTNACRLKRKPEIADRIEEIIRENALNPEGVSRKRAWIQARYLDLFNRAVEKDKLKEADSILLNIARINGEIIERRHVVAEVTHTPDAGELRSQLASILSELTALEGETIEADAEPLPFPETDPED